MVSENDPGFFGKIPSKGDFLHRRIARSFLDPWDSWLQKSIARSKEQLEQGWLETYLTSPIWRFAVAAGVCSDQPHAGVLMPSVDKVGRYFPLTIAVPIPKGFNILQLPKDLNDWFDSAEQLALSALDEPFDLDEFDNSVAHLDVPVSVAPITHTGSGSSPNVISTHSSGKSTHIKIASNHEMVGPYVQFLNQMLQTLYLNYSIWWTSGSQHVEPCFISCAGLPPVDGFSAFLDGRWALWGWQQQEESRVLYETRSNNEQGPETDTAQTPHIPDDWEYPV
jgi:type VI secretion system protein ImpM